MEIKDQKEIYIIHSKKLHYFKYLRIGYFLNLIKSKINIEIDIQKKKKKNNNLNH